MKKRQMIALYNLDQRIDVEYPDMKREVFPNVVRLIDTSLEGEGMVIYSQLNSTNVDETIRQQVNYFESIGQDFEWKVFHYDQPLDLKERLESFGFSIGEPETLVVLDLHDMPEVLQQPTRHSIQRITDPAKIKDVLSVEEQVWEEDFSRLGDFLQQTLINHPVLISVYLAYVGGQPVSAAWTLFTKHSQFASLWGGSTIQPFRRQGLYTALLAVRAQEAVNRHVRYLSVDASDMSRPILEKYGFEKIAVTYPCKWKVQSSN